MKTDDKEVYFRNLRKVFSNVTQSDPQRLISTREGQISVPFAHFVIHAVNFLIATNDILVYGLQIGLVCTGLRLYVWSSVTSQYTAVSTNILI